MTSKETIYIVGAGAIGFPLAALLTKAGRNVVAVRSSKGDNSGSTVEITVRNDSHRLYAAVRTISLSKLDSLDGMIVVESYLVNGILQQAFVGAGGGTDSSPGFDFIRAELEFRGGDRTGIALPETSAEFWAHYPTGR